MAGPAWVNTYNLTEDQITSIDLAEEAMDMLDLTKAEKILNKLKEEDPSCIPVLNILGHLHGRYLSDYEVAISYYDQVLKLEPENAWACLLYTSPSPRDCQ